MPSVAVRPSGDLVTDQAASTVRELLLARAKDGSTGVIHGDRSWTWQAHVAESSRRARWLLDHRSGADDDPFHIGLLASNTADFSFWLGACALSGAVAVGLNPTRTDAELVRDARHTECAMVLVDEAHADRAKALSDAGLVVRHLDRLGLEVDAMDDAAPDVTVAPGDLWMLIFTSGTTSDPKAVRCSHGRLLQSGTMVGLMAGLSADDVVLTSMPLFHSNAVIAGWLAALSVGAALVVRDFSARGFVEDLRRHQVTYANYVGKALSYVVNADVHEDDGSLPLRVVFGNEASEDTLHAFAARFNCRVIDAYGSTEGGISLLRTDQTPRGALGVGIGDVRVLDALGNECPTAEVAHDGTLLNAEEAIGELVNLGGAGGFEGYWRNPEADAERLQGGHFHSGDLAWRDPEGFFWFAGRNSDWVRVDGENLAVAPIERTLQDHPGVREAVVVAVPDPAGGDQILACLEVDDVETMDPQVFAEWCQQRRDLSAKSLPRFVHVTTTLPRTPTNKVVRAQLRARGLDTSGVMWERSARSTQFTLMGASDG